MSPDWAAKPTTVPYAKFGDPQSLNLYSYVENGPVNRIDADGHSVNALNDGNPGFTSGPMYNYINCSEQGCTSSPFDNGSTNSSRTGRSVSGTQQQNQSLSQNGLKFIECHEARGCKPDLTVYLDTSKNPTIGYGHLVRKGEDFSKGITAKQAIDLLVRDVRSAESFVNQHLSVYQAQTQFDALVDVAYNSPRAAGVLLNAINASQYDRVPFASELGPSAFALSRNDFVDTLRPGTGGIPGLINRRTDEFNLYDQ